MNLYFLHGFLGLPSDWVPTLDELHKDPNFEAQVHLMNLWRSMDTISEETMFEDWAGEFSKELQGEDNWLVGYSLGGRLLLNLPSSTWSKIKGLVLISSHPGLDQKEARETRLLNDKKWSERFQQQDWNELMQAWNGQDIFQQDVKRPERYEEDYQRDTLAKAMSGWSLGRQKDFLPTISQFPFPVYYIYGEKDKKYADIAGRVSEASGENAIELPGGHSPLFSCPKNLSRVLRFILLDQ